MNRKEKIITAIAIALYYAFLPLALYYLYVFAVLFGIICLYSEPLFYTLFIALPVLLLLLPVIMRFVRRVKFRRAIWKSFIAVAVWLVIIFCVRMGIAASLETFATDKWESYPNLRYLMMEDLEEKYDFVGMTEAAVNEILGDCYRRDNENTRSYFIDGFLFGEKDFCLVYDENGIVTKTYTDVISFN